MIFRYPTQAGKTCLQSLGDYWRTLRELAPTLGIAITYAFGDDCVPHAYFIADADVAPLLAAYRATKLPVND